MNDSIRDFESEKFSGRGGFVHVRPIDVSIHAIRHGPEQPVQFGPTPFRHQFDRAVGQVPNRSGDIIRPRDPMHGISKTDALDMAAIANVSSLIGKLFGHKFTRIREKPRPNAGIGARPADNPLV